MIYAATGHRPDKLGGYSAAAHAKLCYIAAEWIMQAQPTELIIGMALGWDIAIAEAAYELSIPYTAAVPFPQQASQWPTLAQDRWRYFLRAAKLVHYVDIFYSKTAFQARNIWMVDHADALVAMWNGSAGGTRNCIAYAKRVGKPVQNLFPLWRPSSPRQHAPCPSRRRIAEKD